MSFQATVRAAQALGIIGEFLVDGPTRSQPYQIDPAATAANCVIGRAFTAAVATGLVSPGGTPSDTVVFAGILGLPKTQASRGDSTGSLAPTLAVAPGTIGEFLSMGTVVILLAATANLGWRCYYATATGIITAVAPSAAIPAGHVDFPSPVYIDRVSTTLAPGLAAARLTV